MKDKEKETKETYSWNIRVLKDGQLVVTGKNGEQFEENWNTEIEAYSKIIDIFKMFKETALKQVSK